jgi:hypothetical protein
MSPEELIKRLFAHPEQVNLPPPTPREVVAKHSALTRRLVVPSRHDLEARMRQTSSHRCSLSGDLGQYRQPV